MTFHSFMDVMHYFLMAAFFIIIAASVAIKVENKRSRD